MLISFSIGSKGLADKSYSIYIPMEWSGGKEINLDKNKFIGSLQNHKCILEKHHYIYSIKVEGFSTIQECLEFLDRLKIAIRWLTIKEVVGIKIPKQISDIDFYKSPLEVNAKSELKVLTDKVAWDKIEGEYDAEQIVIIQENKKLLRNELGRMRAILGANPSRIVENLNECLNFNNLNNIKSEKKLLLAIELYGTYKFENSITGKFIKLVTILEALLPEGKITGSAGEAIRLAMKVVREYIDNFKKSDKNTKNEANILENLYGDIGRLKNKSITVKLEEYINNFLNKIPDPEAYRFSSINVTDIYSTRGILLHTGKYDESELEKYISILEKLVPDILKFKFLEKVVN